MRFNVLATDYDETIAEKAAVDQETVDALRRLRQSGRSLVLVTGRFVENLHNIFPEIELFHLVIAENGAVLYEPDTRSATLLTQPPPPEFAAALSRKGVVPLAVGKVMVAAWSEHLPTIRQTITELNLPLEITSNRRAALVLPAGIDKASGLRAALARLGSNPAKAVGIGDAENDAALLAACGCGVAVANALPELQAQADFVTSGRAGAGVRELIDLLLENDLANLLNAKVAI